MALSSQINLDLVLKRPPQVYSKQIEDENEVRPAKLPRTTFATSRSPTNMGKTPIIDLTQDTDDEMT